MRINILHNPLNTLGRLTMLVLFGAAGSLKAQTVVPAISQISTQPQALQDYLGTKTSGASLESAFATLASEPPLHVGQTTFLPHFFDRFLYGSGIQIAPGRPINTTINTVAPGLLVDYGKQWTLDYTPSWVTYSNRAFRDTTDQNASINGIGQFGDWTLTLAGNFLDETQPLVETGMQTSEKDYTAAVKASRQLGSKVLLDFNFDEAIRNVVGFPDSKETSTLDWVNYQINPRFDVGLGGSLGYVSVSQGADTFYASPEAQLSLRPTDKITLNLNGGVEHSEFIGSAAGSLNSPIYSISVQYQPAETTKLVLTSGQTVSSSYFQNQTTRSVQWSAALQQRLLVHFYLNADVEENNVRYFSSGAGTSPLNDRGDRQITANIRLSTVVLGRGTIAIFFQKTKNASNIPGYGFSSGQVGFEVGYRF